MAPVFPNYPYSGQFNRDSVRTPDSLVWGTTRARELVSGVRFSWDNTQNKTFVEFLRTFGRNYRNSDIEKLLYYLDLDGYENIHNEHGESVYRLIMEKVMRKLKSTTDKMVQDGSIESNKISNPMKYRGNMFDPRHNPFYASDYSDVKPGIPVSHNPKSKSTTRPTPPGDLFLRMRRPGVPQDLKTPSVRSPSLSPKTTRVKSPQDSQARQDSPSGTQSENLRNGAEFAFYNAHRTLKNLIGALTDVRDKLNKAEPLFSDLPLSKEAKKWSEGLFGRMWEAHENMRVDASELQEYVAAE
ncbi:hypothetical protein Daesc_007223 [Daldinia eschscholtzii]|uniref:Uncharacterized protein n=1 Tax=Daldinia eschscholtzii TaxID=292717 RepID=A0AAX6MDC7_9PEZI